MLLYTRNLPQYQKQKLIQMKGFEEVFQAIQHKRQASMATLIFNKIYFQQKLIKMEGKDTSYASKKKIPKMMSQFWISIPQIMLTLLFLFLVFLPYYMFFSELSDFCGYYKLYISMWRFGVWGLYSFLWTSSSVQNIRHLSFWFSIISF